MGVKCLIPLFVALLCASDAMAGVVVIMRRQAQTAGKYVRVCDIARVDGPGEQAREVAMTVLGPAPRTGEIREITRWDIENRLFEMGVAADVSFSGNDMVMVYGDGAPMRMIAPDDAAFQQLVSMPGASASPGGNSEAHARHAAKPFARPLAKPSPYVYERERPEQPAGLDDLLTEDAKKRVGRDIANYFIDRYKAAGTGRDDIEVDAKIVSSSGAIPYSAHEVRVENAEGRVPGSVSLRLRVRDTDEAPPRVVMVEAEAAVFGKALVAIRSIPRGESMMKDDVAVQRVRMESGKSYLPPSAGSVVGREARRAFKAGEVILADEAPMGDAVKRGSLVVMKTEGRGWDVQSKVKALGAGAVGDVITVEDTNNKTKYPARITGPGTVAVLVRHDPHGVVKKD